MIQAAFPATARILVVDDSESNRYVIATWLRRAGYEVVEAKSGTETFARLAAQPFDLVILDVNLPDMSGYDVCERIKAGAASAVLPVLHVSATATDSSDLSEGLRRGAEAYLAEPVEREALVATVEALLRTAAAQRTAIRLAWQLRQLNEATHALNEAADLEALVATIAREAHALFDGCAAAVGVVVDDRTIAGVAPRDRHTDDDPLSAHEIDVLRGAVARGRLAAAVAEYFPDCRARHYVAAPLDNPDGQRGIVIIGFNDPALTPEIEDETGVVLSLFARAARTALKNMHTHDIERRIALTLQQSLLPAALPRIAGLDVAVRYVASTEHAEVGGDFYEMFALDADRVVFAIGDVAGHSLEAATVMAQLRTAIRAYALAGHGPVEMLAELNGLVRHFHPDMTATVCCVFYERHTGRCTFANAGHLPPLIAGPDGATFLPTGGLLLGAGQPQIDRHDFVLRPSEAMLLFTDGLVERRRESIEAGLDRLARSAAGVAFDAQALCDRVLCEAGPSVVVDDIALLAIRRTA